MLLFSCYVVPDSSETPWTVASQASLLMGFPRQYWSGLPFPYPGDSPNPGIKPRSLQGRGRPLPLSHQGNSKQTQVSSVQFSRSVVSDSLRPHGLQRARPPWPSPAHRACSNSCPLSERCHPTISSSVVPVSSHLQSFPTSGSFLRSQLFASGGQSIGVSASASVLPMNTQD